MIVLFKGRFRLYYNRKKDWPNIWSVDKGTQQTEQNFEKLKSVKVTLETNQNKGATYPEPTGWFEGEGTVYTDERGTEVLIGIL